MMGWRWVGLVAALCSCCPGSLLAQQAAEPLQWLQKAAASAEKQNYSGIFIYRNGNNVETSRITHVWDGAREQEFLEVMDGSPRQVVRENGETKCYLPESRLLVVERQNSRRNFPSSGLLPGSLAGLAEHYVFRKGALSRVAGYEAQSVFADAKDEWRYSRQFWIETKTGLLLKSVLLGENGEPRESFAFSELKVGQGIDKAALKNVRSSSGGDWRIKEVRSIQADGDDMPWILRDGVPGFSQISGMKRQIGGTEEPEAAHLVFSDGLAAVSIFIEPRKASSKARSADPAGAFAVGAMNGYRRSMGGFQVIAIGDVPPNTLKRLGDGIGAKRK